MDRVREVIVQEYECCEPFNDKYGQPSLHFFEMLPAAASYTEYMAQRTELQTFLDANHACKHIREIAEKTHKTLCGNDEHVTTSLRIQMFPGLEPELVEELLAYL